MASENPNCKLACFETSNTATTLRVRAAALRAQSILLREAMQQEKRDFETETLRLRQARRDLKRDDTTKNDTGTDTHYSTHSVHARKESSRLKRRLRDVAQDHEETMNDWTDKQQLNRLHIQQLRFQELCLLLRHNDASVTHVTSRACFPRGYAKPLGEALVGNETVTSIDLDLSALIPILQGDVISRATALLEPLLRHIRCNPSLRRVRLRHVPFWVRPDEINAIVGLLLCAVTENRSIEDVTLTALMQTPAVLLFVASSKFQTLKKFNVDMFDSSLVDAAAFARATALESLTVSGINQNGPSMLTLLSAVKTACPALQELQLSCISPHVFAPVAFWHILIEIFHSKTMLRHLKLERFPFDAHAMNSLIRCLSLADGSGPSPTTISKLSLCECIFREEARSNFCRFMQTRVSPLDGQGSSLRELHGFGNHEIADVLAAVPTDAESRAGRTITTVGSRLCTVTLPGLLYVDVNKFEVLSPFIRLKRLHVRLDSTVPSACAKVERLIPLATSIQELHVAKQTVCSSTSGAVQAANASQTLVDMMRGNATRGQFSAAKRSSRRLFNAAQLRRIDAYCQRNQFLIQLLDKHPWRYNSNHDSGDTMAVQDTVNNLLYPLLVQVATPLPINTIYGIVSTLSPFTTFVSDVPL